MLVFETRNVSSNLTRDATIRNGSIAQLVEARDLKSLKCGFKSHPSHKFINTYKYVSALIIIAI